jgi:hypothetical protein
VNLFPDIHSAWYERLFFEYFSVLDSKYAAIGNFERSFYRFAGQIAFASDKVVSVSLLALGFLKCLANKGSS